MEGFSLLSDLSSAALAKEEASTKESFRESTTADQFSI